MWATIFLRRPVVILRISGWVLHPIADFSQLAHPSCAGDHCGHGAESDEPQKARSPPRRAGQRPQRGKKAGPAWAAKGTLEREPQLNRCWSGDLRTKTRLVVAGGHGVAPSQYEGPVSDDDGVVALEVLFGSDDAT